MVHPSVGSSCSLLCGFVVTLFCHFFLNSLPFLLSFYWYFFLFPPVPSVVHGVAC